MPRNIFLSSEQKIFLKCIECKFEFEKPIKNILKCDNPCTHCTGYELCNIEDCKICHDRSFTSNERFKNIIFEDNQKNDTICDDINHNKIRFKKNTKKKFNFKCDECNHIFTTSIKSINGQNSWCPYCASKKLCDNKNCNFCFNKSFASVEKSKYIVNTQNNDPRQIFKLSGIYCDFICESNHLFNTTISAVTYGIWCGKCTKKTEGKFYDEISKIYPNIRNNVKFDWCKSDKNYYLPFDFTIDDKKIIIEIDGPQHFIQIANWGSVEETRKRDLLKMEYGIKNGWNIIRILQKDIWEDTFDWKKEIFDLVTKIDETNEIKTYFICKNDEYNDFY